MCGLRDKLLNILEKENNIDLTELEVGINGFQEFFDKEISHRQSMDISDDEIVFRTQSFADFLKKVTS